MIMDPRLCPITVVLDISASEDEGVRGKGRTEMDVVALFLEPCNNSLEVLYVVVKVGHVPVPL